MCVSVRARKSEIAELATGCLGCVLLHQLVSVQRAHVYSVHMCQWMCKSWSLCCSVQTLVRVRLKSWTSVWCSAHRACTKAQKQQSSGQQQRIRAAGASPRCMNPNPRHSQCAVRMSMSHFPSLCIFPANTIFVYFPQTQSLYIPRKHNLCIFPANTVFVYSPQTQFIGNAKYTAF